MHAMIPDTVEGALILSAIDFLLSFVIISGIGAVLALFPLLNRVGKARVEPRPKAAARPAVIAPEAEEHVAAIAAAVYATMAGAHRIVSIEPAGRRGDWVAEGRMAQHTSHTPIGRRH
jgi:hypothetical protein